MLARIWDGPSPFVEEGAGISSLPDLWAALGMQRANEDTAAVLRSIERFLEYVQAPACFALS